MASVKETAAASLLYSEKGCPGNQFARDAVDPFPRPLPFADGHRLILKEVTREPCRRHQMKQFQVSTRDKTIGSR